MKTESVVVFAGTLLFVAMGFGVAIAAPDAGKAEALIEANKCGKCHAPAKTKTGPSWKKTAAKYKGKEAEGEAAIIKNITTGPMVKVDEEGTEEAHTIIKTKDEAELKNLAQWILAH